MEGGLLNGVGGVATDFYHCDVVHGWYTALDACQPLPDAIVRASPRPPRPQPNFASARGRALSPDLAAAGAIDRDRGSGPRANLGL